MRTLVKALRARLLAGSDSTSGRVGRPSGPNVLREPGVCRRISQRTLNRALDITGGHADEMIKAMFEGLKKAFGITATNAFAAGSAVVVRSPKPEPGALGRPRDKNPGKRQAGFTVAEPSKRRPPSFVRTFKGDASDPEQYRSALPGMTGMPTEGSRTVADDGGAAGDMPSSIASGRHERLSRVKMNASDYGRIGRAGRRTCPAPRASPPRRGRPRIGRSPQT
jgi:hypothetical protein